MISQLGAGLQNGKSYWIGLTDLEEEGFLVWTNGRPLVWSQIPGSSNSESSNCGSITSSGNWKLNDCEQTHPAICQLPRSPCATSAFANASVCFWRTIAGVSDTDWQGALQSCHKDGGSLVIIPHSQYEAFMKEHFKFQMLKEEHRLWIAMKRNSADKWAWWRYPTVQGELLEDAAYKKKPVEQNRDNEDCVMIYQDLQWHDWPCGGVTKANYICQRSSNDMCQTVYHSNQGVCYWTLDALYTWDEAVKQCDVEGGMLAVLFNADDAEFIKIHLQLNDSSEYYMGLKMISATEALWLSGAFYTNSSLGGASECAHLKISTTSQIVFTQCSQPKKSLCMRAAVPCTAFSQDGRCFWRVTSLSHNLTWTGALDYCKRVGGTLAVIDNQQTLQLLQTKEIIRSDRPSVWIGLSDRAVESVFRWADTAPMSWEVWKDGSTGGPHQPDGAKDENCVILSNNNFLDVKCDQTHEFVCQRPESVTCANPADACSNALGPSTKTCQKLYDSPASFDSASQTCKGWGNGTLVKISSAEENANVQKLLSAESWIGANSRAVLSVFRWTWDNYILTWEQWVTGQPRDPTKRCVAMQQDGGWMPKSCDSTMPFVCQAKPENLCEFSPAEVSIGSTTYTRVRIGTTTSSYRCPPGYIVPSLINTADPGTQEVGCGCPGQWDQVNFLGCVYVDCRTPTPVSFATPQYNTTFYNSSLLYQCLKGYHNPGRPFSETKTRVTCKADGTWSAVPPACQVVDCGQPNNADHSTKTYASTFYNNTVTYSCDAGYFIDPINLIPSKSVRCQEDGKWEANVNCTVIDCGRPPNITYAELIFQNGTYYSSATFYQCPDIYLFPNLKYINAIWCNASGQWTELGPCKSLWKERRGKGCPKFKDDESFRVTFNNDGKFDYATVNCREGYQLVVDGTKTRTVYCLNSLEWEKPKILCEREACAETLSNPIVMSAPDLSDEETEAVTPIDKYSDQIMKTCDLGQRVQNGLKSLKTKCFGKSGWMPYIPTCKALRCLPPPYVKDSIIVPLQGQPQGQGITSDVGRKYEVQCIEGYLFPDGTRSAPLSCSADLQWSYKQEGNCGKDRCPQLQIPKNSTIDKEIALFGTVVNVACEYGFKFPDNDVVKEVTCTASQTWKPPLVDCIEIICPPPPIVVNSRRTGDGQKYENVIRYDCEGNRRTEDGTKFKQIKCELESRWSEDNFTCQVGRCESPPSVPNAQWRRTVYDGRSPLIYGCLPGYLFFPSNATEMTATCDNATAKWRMPFTKCEPLYCPPTPEVNNASRNSDRRRYKNIVTYQCDFGFWSKRRSFTTVCTVHGNWSDTLEECQLKECGQFPEISNSSANEINGTFFYLDIFNISCDPGYWFRRDEYHRIIHCDGDAQWKPLHSKCKEITCEDLPIWNGIRANSSLTYVGTVINVTCEVNMTLSTYSPFEMCMCDEDGDWMCYRKDAWEVGLSECQDVPKPKAEKVTKEAESAKAVGTVAIIILFLALGLIILLDLGANGIVAFYKIRAWYNSRNKSKRLVSPEDTPVSSTPVEEVGLTGNVVSPKPPGQVPPVPIIFHKENTIMNYNRAQLTFNQSKVSPENNVVPIGEVTDIDVG